MDWLRKVILNNKITNEYELNEIQINLFIIEESKPNEEPSEAIEQETQAVTTSKVLGQLVGRVKTCA